MHKVQKHINTELTEFSDQVAMSLKPVKVEQRCFAELGTYPLIKGNECIYVMDWKQSRITYQRGVEDMLGYTAEEFTMDLALSYFHPEDLNFVNRIIKGIVNHSTQHKVDLRDHYINLTFRLRKKDGTYIKVLRKSNYYEVDSQGCLISNFSCLTNIDFIDNNNKVEWDLCMNNIDIEGFKKNVHHEFIGFFTKKELEIIQYLADGKTTKQISEILFSSPSTVATHRKNILRKCRCHNVKELLEFCTKNGIL